MLSHHVLAALLAGIAGVTTLACLGVAWWLLPTLLGPIGSLGLAVSALGGEAWRWGGRALDEGRFDPLPARIPASAQLVPVRVGR